VTPAPNDPAPPFRDALIAASVGALLRVVFVIWAAARFAPVEDGRFYHVIATRMAAGEGYTWLWPDGVVTYAAHYPVGYPALVAAAYALVAPEPIVAMLLNAALGSLAVISVHRIAASVASRAGALLAALGIALHPALVAYTPALMTEGISAALLASAGWVALGAAHSSRARFWRWLLLLGVVLGLAVLVRPQSLLLAPLFGALAVQVSAGARTRALVAAAVTALSLVVCLPWTVRNAARMDRVVLVSANGGWNLLIGAIDGATGTFVPIEGDKVPAECRTVFGEVAKDACFGRAALASIAAAPLSWLALIPKKLGFTFDYSGAPGWYLHVSNPADFPESAKVFLGVAETVWQRLLVGLGLFALWRAPGPRKVARGVLCVLGAACLFSPSAWISHALLPCAALLLGKRLAAHPPAAMAAAAVAATAVTHAVFFGAGRYSLVVFPLLGALAGTSLLHARLGSGPQPTT
jgi:4-amino-4-deoxy-L-arabinose transferase-like glycosyltransferase